MIGGYNYLATNHKCICEYKPQFGSYITNVQASLLRKYCRYKSTNANSVAQYQPIYLCRLFRGYIVLSKDKPLTSCAMFLEKNLTFDKTADEKADLELNCLHTA